MPISLLLLGFLFGARHALDADHLAAVASLATGSRSLGETLRQGAFWGIGHSVTLLLFGVAVLVLGTSITEQTAQWLEVAVGLMLLGLGSDVLRRLYAQRVHVHAHRHADGTTHFHFHAHGGRRGHEAADRHSHGHGRNVPLRALLVGLMHGMAGSAALIVLAMQNVVSPVEGVVYIVLFALGSIAGMVALSAMIAWPLRASARGFHRVQAFLHGAVGVLTIGIGLAIVVERLPALVG